MLHTLGKQKKKKELYKLRRQSRPSECKKMCEYVLTSRCSHVVVET